MSAWETSIKVHLGKRTVDAPSAEAFFEEQMRANAFTYLPIAPAHVFRAACLPRPHRALVEGLSLVTRDDFRAHGLAVAWRPRSEKVAQWGSPRQAPASQNPPVLSVQSRCKSDEKPPERSRWAGTRSIWLACQTSQSFPTRQRETRARAARSRRELPYSGRSTPEPPISLGKSFCFGSPSRTSTTASP